MRLFFRRERMHTTCHWRYKSIKNSSDVRSRLRKPGARCSDCTWSTWRDGRTKSKLKNNQTLVQTSFEKSIYTLRKILDHEICVLDLLIHDDISIKLRFQIVFRLFSLAVASSEVNLSGHFLISMHFFSHISVLSFDSYQSMEKARKRLINILLLHPYRAYESAGWRKCWWPRRQQVYGRGPNLQGETDRGAWSGRGSWWPDVPRRPSGAENGCQSVGWTQTKGYHSCGRRWSQNQRREKRGKPFTF